MPYIRLPNTVDFLQIDADTTVSEIDSLLGLTGPGTVIVYDGADQPVRIYRDVAGGPDMFNLAVAPGQWLFVERNRLGNIVGIDIDPHGGPSNTAVYAIDPYEES